MEDPGVRASASIRESLDELVASALERQWTRWPGLRESFDAYRLEQTTRDTRYHLEFLESALWAGEPLFYEDYVAWVRVLFANLGLPSEWVAGSIEDVRDAVVELLPAGQADAAAAIVDRALSANAAAADPPPFIRPNWLHGALATRYFGAVTAADQDKAWECVLEAVEAGTPVKEIYTHVLWPVQQELGREWHAGRLSVAQEHAATAATLAVVSQLRPWVLGADRSGKILVAACVGDEQHELGIRMVTDFFEIGGWRTHYLGAAVPANSIVSYAAQVEADLVALSATMAFHVRDVAEVVSALRAEPKTGAIKVIVGGHPFDRSKDLWSAIGADGCARDAARAVEVGERLTRSA